MSNFPYAEAETKYIPCNFCGRSRFKVLSTIGQDKLPLRTVLCRNCGLIFINPQMTSDWYSKYYQFEYRAKTIEHGGEGRTIDPLPLFELGKAHGKALAPLMKPYLVASGSILEVGSGTGGVLTGLKEILGREVLGIEPSESEATFAEKNGVHTLPYLMEEVEEHEKNLPSFSAVICTQSLNHLLDPHFFLSWSYDHLPQDGVLVLEVMNFRHQLKKAGHYRNAVKIDHPYMFTPEVLVDFVQSAGFDIRFIDTDEERDGMLRGNSNTPHGDIPDTHIRIIASKSSRKPFETLVTRKPSFLARLMLFSPVVYLYYILAYRLKFFSR